LHPDVIMKKYLLFSLLVTFLVSLNLEASEKDSICFQNQISILSLYNPSSDATLLLEGMYIPQIDYLRDFSGDKRISAEVSGRFNLNMGFRPFDDTYDVQDPTGSAKLYRAWVRFSTQRNEIRAGLQQLNFGSASLLRPLQWFDGIDPTDPLRLTNGVWGVLDRYYFKNNSTLWLWGLYGNKDSRVWDPIQLHYNLPEFGFRFQQPIPSGELALSMNHRSIKMNLGTSLESRFSEMKLGLDGKWDVGPGLWFEDSYSFTSMESPLKSGLNLLTVGADLTREGLDGLSFTAEHMLSSNFSSTMTTINSNFSALMGTWPINIVSRLSGIVLYSWETGYLFRYLTYSADFDKSSIYLIGFWNPNVTSLQLSFGSSSGSFSGYGLQLMYVVHL
jgi:hypothetical protein